MGKMSHSCRNAQRALIKLHLFSMQYSSGLKISAAMITEGLMDRTRIVQGLSLIHI